MNLSVSGLCFGYHRHPVLHDVTFSLPGGSILGILGRNGVGKSTLLKCMNGILRPQAGTIRLGEKNISDMACQQIARHFGYVPQSSVNPELTVFDTVLLGRRPYLRWAPTAHDLHIVEEVLDTVQLKPLALRPVNSLSGGEQQKVCIARALAQEPDVLLMDEPTSSLDLKNQLRVIHLLVRSVRERGLSALVCVHDINLALRFVDYFLFLHQGTVYACVPKAEVTGQMIKEVYDVDVIVRQVGAHRVVVPVDLDVETQNAEA
jgi:iron complex transport system ATP-binding protein